MDGILGAILPLIIGGIVGFIAAMRLMTPRRRPAAEPVRHRPVEAARPSAAAQTAGSDHHRAEAKRLTGELAAAKREIDAAVQARRALVATHQAEIERRDRSIADRKAELQERDTRVTMLLERVAALGGAERAPTDDAPAVDLRAVADQAQTAARTAEQKAQEREQRLVAVQSEMASVREELSNVRKRNGELSRSVEELTPRFAEKNRLIAQLESTLAEAQAELARRPSAPLAAVPAVDPTAAEKAANAKLLAAYKHDMARVEEEKSALRRELAKRDARIRQLSERGAKGPNAGQAAVPDASPVGEPVPAATAASSSAPTTQANGASNGASNGAPSGAPNGAATEASSEARPEARSEELSGAPSARRDRASDSGRSDDLKRIKGIGPVYAQLLAAAGFTTFAGVATADAEALAAAVTRDNGVPPDVTPWIDEARGFASAG